MKFAHRSGGLEPPHPRRQIGLGRLQRPVQWPVMPVARASGLPYRSASRLLPRGGETRVARDRSGAGASGTHAIRQAKTPALRVRSCEWSCSPGRAFPGARRSTTPFRWRAREDEAAAEVRAPEGETESRGDERSQSAALTLGTRGNEGGCDHHWRTDDALGDCCLTFPLLPEED